MGCLPKRAKIYKVKKQGLTIFNLIGSGIKMPELEEKIIEESERRKHVLVTAKRKDLENADYHSDEYRLFTFDFLGEQEQKGKDDVKMIAFIAESDLDFHAGP